MKDRPAVKKPAYWTRLSEGFRVQLRARGLPAPVSEYHWRQSGKTRDSRFDFAWPDLGVALEVQGGAFLDGGGGHTRGAAYQRDCIRRAEALLQGWRLLEFTPQQVADGTAVKYLVRLFGSGAKAGKNREGAYRPPPSSSVVPFGSPKRT